MKNKKDIGNYYEKLGKKYLQDQGYSIIITNYRYKTIDIYKPLEIDIIAFKQDILYCIEVKYRKHSSSFFPIGEKKNY